MGIGTHLIQHFPFPDDNAVLQLVAAEKPVIFIGIKYADQTMLVSTPFIGCSMLFSLLYIFFVRPRKLATLAPRPLCPLAADRERLFLVAGELHHPKRPGTCREAALADDSRSWTLHRHCHLRSEALAKPVAVSIPSQSKSLRIELAIGSCARQDSYSKSRVTLPQGAEDPKTVWQGE